MSTLWLNRYIIETTAPMAINSGRRETGFDTQLARDANGLPYIPASSFTGVWRHLTQSVLGEDYAKQWFGSLEENQQEKNASFPKLHIQHGLLLDSQGKVALGLLPDEALNQDALFKRLLDARPHYRDHVRINDRGVAEEHGKYDQILLPKGVRFCIDVRWQGQAAYESSWQEVQALLAHPSFALGASTRNGLGRFKVVASSCEKLELQGNPQAGKQMTAFVKRENLPKTTSITLSENTPFATLELSALDTWRCGKGSRPLGKVDDHTDSFTYSEPYISWQNNQATWQETPQAILCGSSIKGMLAHRLAYHYRRLTGKFAETMAEASHAEWEKRPDELRDLLGDASQEEDRLLAGKLIVEDVIVNSVKPMVRTHTSIDRFTGGVRYGALYSEEVLWQPSFVVKLHLVPNTELSAELTEALKATLEDLKHGLLPLGAGSGRGSSLVEHKENQRWDIDWQQIKTQEAVA